MSWMKINPAGVVLAACTYILLGAGFYSRSMLAKFWPDLVNHMQKQADSKTLTVYFGAFFSAALIAYALGCLMKLMQTKTVFSGVLVGVLVWAGFVLPTIFSPVIFGKKPFAMFWLDAAYYFTAYICMSIVMGKFANRPQVGSKV